MKLFLKVAVLPLICVILFGGKNDTYQNELTKYNKLYLSKSKYNYDGYNDFNNNNGYIL